MKTYLIGDILYIIAGTKKIVLKCKGYFGKKTEHFVQEKSLVQELRYLD